MIDRDQEKKRCYSCSGRGHKERPVVIGKIVTLIRDICTACRGSGYTK